MVEKHVAQLHQFLRELASRWKKPLKLILTGAWASASWGYVRATQDVDFEVSGLAATEAEAFDTVARAAGEAAGLAVQYSTNIDRWSSIVLLDYREHTKRWKRIGTLDVHVLDVRHWSIGKLNRYIDRDIQDLIEAFRRLKPDPVTLAQFWRKAIANSPASTQQWQTKQQALSFFRQHGQQVWGERLPLKQIEQVFQ